MLRRNLYTSARALQAKVLPRIENAEQLAKFLQTSNGNVHDLIPGPTSVVDSKIVRKMLRLSGLESDISPETEQKWIKALNTQIGFINQLQGQDKEHISQNLKPEVFRLIASDHQPSKPLGLTELLHQVEQNQKQTCEEGFKDFNNFINSNVKV